MFEARSIDIVFKRDRHNFAKPVRIDKPKGISNIYVNQKEKKHEFLVLITTDRLSKYHPPSLSGGGGGQVATSKSHS